MRIIRVMGCPSFRYASQERYLVKFASDCKALKHQLSIVYENHPSSSSFQDKLKSVSADIFTIGPKRSKWKPSEGSPGNVYPKFLNLSPLLSFFKQIYWFFNIRKITNLQRIIQSQKVDIIHSYFEPSNYAILLGKLQSKKTFVTIGNPVTNKNISKLGFFEFIGIFWLAIFPLYFVDKIIVLSNEIKSQLISFGINKSRISIIPSGIDTKYFSRDMARTKDIKSELGIEDEFIIGFTGRLDKQKNLIFTLEIFAEVLKTLPSAKLILVGDGSMSQKIKQKIRELDLEQNVIMTGLRDDIRDILSVFNLYLSTSLYEGKSSSVMESISLGVPVLSSNYKSAKETIVNGVNGFIIKSQNKKDFTDKIIHLERNRNELSKLVETTRNYSACFDFSIRSKRTIDEYVMSK